MRMNPCCGNDVGRPIAEDLSRKDSANRLPVLVPQGIGV